MTGSGLALLLGLLGALLGAASAPAEEAGGSPADDPGDAPWFEDVTAAAGVDRPHRNRSFDNPYAHIMEGYTALGAAVAVADYDGDGDLDLFVTDSSEDGRNLLYRNRGDFTFEEVGEAAGVAHGNDASNASADALWFDYDGDGREDLLVVRFGRSQLFRNEGPGPDAGPAGVTFREVTEEVGLGRRLNSITAVAFDADGDGDLDLLLGNYFQPVDLFDPDTPHFFPESFETAENGGGVTLYRNEGPDAEGPRFVDATAEAGLAHHTGWTLDVGHADADHDGDEDLYVAADFGTDRFFLNDGDGTFTDATTEALGGPDTKKGMNAEWGDFDNDGLFDVYVTNITDEYMREGNFLWRNLGPGSGTDGGTAFTDVARETGTWDTGWGWAGKFFDSDNDGWLDLFVVNGWVSAGPENYVLDVFELIMASAEDDGVDLADARNWPPMGDKTLSGYQRNHLFHNREGTLFRDDAPRHGLDSIRDARGVAVADFDDDGRLDLFVTNADDEPTLYRNLQPTGNAWLELALEGSGANPRAVGARVWATAGGVQRVRFVDGGNGFAGQSTRRIHFGLGDAGTVERLEIAWPSGRRQVFEDLPAGRIYRAVEGQPDLEPFQAREEGEAPPAIRFEEIGEAAGARHVHSTRSFGERHKAEVLEMFTDGGAAVAVGDFDGDGHDDLFLTDSGEGEPNHLLRNLYGETGEPRFVDVAEEAGVAGGNGPDTIVADALWLDFDDDGRLDLLVARFGTPLLYRNLGPSGEGGEVRFREVSEAAGLTEFANTIAVIAFDYDGDGWLDLLLGNYFRPVNLLDLDTRHVLPEDLDGAENGGGVSLWRNVPGGSEASGGRAFVDVTEAEGLAGHTGWSLDLGHADLDNDGDQDVYVAGDYGTDRLFLNRGPAARASGEPTFVDVTEEALGGLDTKKGMNVDVGDYDRNGFLDVYVTNITDEYMRECNMLWHNLGTGGDGEPPTFLDLSSETGTCDTDWGWAAKFADLDNDGWEDLYVVNGLRSAGEENYIPLLLETIITPGVDFSDLNSYPNIGDRTWSGYQPQRLFRNLGDGTFREMGAEAGVATELDGRGIGVADLDSDGRLDLVQTNARQPSLLYRNVTEGVGRWLELRLVGAGVAEEGSNRQAVGARVTVTTKGGERFLREVNGGNGYASQSTTRLHFGLGSAEAVERVEIRWPRGRVEVLEAKDGRPPVPLDAVVRIEEGEGVTE